jgi:hypothetical protein
MMLLVLKGDKMLRRLNLGEGFCLESNTWIFDEVYLELIGGS